MKDSEPHFGWPVSWVDRYHEQCTWIGHIHGMDAYYDPRLPDTGKPAIRLVFGPNEDYGYMDTYGPSPTPAQYPGYKAAEPELLAYLNLMS